ncbi:glycosyl transferase [Gillisia sp. M10.2A]|uniref:Glycosyl transferase n=1 Tax=Gillisia lutea TaxID=2909668 RepID=A0ABS9EBY3_9FLAO|nr:glycosyltransferase family protein [Gillisia lutea]MCF4100388.1 glycosyl transferase [Gillisia lutea]
MKILYAIQGTGNGHLSRARDIIPLLRKKGDLDILVSGTQADISLPYTIKYKYSGMSFVFGKKGGVDLKATYIKNNISRFIKEIRSFPVEDYDLIINDFEPISAWAAYLKGKKCISLSHQCAVLSKNAPLPDTKDWLGELILKNYAPSQLQYGFHFATFNKNTYTPVIRQEIRNMEVKNYAHYTVYLPSYSDKKILKVLHSFEEIRWHVFSKHTKGNAIIKNVSLRPISNRSFIKSMATSEGVLCGAGFETPAEALFLKKKLLVIPMKNQYEQHCNAAALKAIGVPILKKFKLKQRNYIEKWLVSDKIVEVAFPDITSDIIDMLIQDHLDALAPKPSLEQHCVTHSIKPLN